MSTIRSSIAALAAGALFARATGLVVALLLARKLGVAGFGDYAAAIQIGSVLGFVVHSGVHAVAQRETASHPDNAGGWIRASIRARVWISLATFAAYAAVVPFLPGDTTLLVLSGALVLPAAFDLRGLADSAGRTRLEVLIESAAGLAHLLLVAGLVATERVAPAWVAAAYLASRCVYAIGVTMSLGDLGPETSRPSMRALVLRSGGPLSIAFAAERITLSSDVLLIRAIAGSHAAGLFAAAEKVSQIASHPIALVGRTLSPHLQASVPHGDPRATLEKALRVSAYAVLPFAAGGWVLAEDLLVRLNGEGYAEGGWTLRWLLLATAVSGVGWRFADMLFAHRRMREYVLPLVLSVTTNWVVSLLMIPAWGAAGSTFGTAVSQCAAMPLSAIFLRRVQAFSVFRPLAAPLAVAAVAAGVAWAVPSSWGALARVGVGGVAGAALFWAFELRHGWDALGRGIEASSGFRPHTGDQSSSGATPS